MSPNRDPDQTGAAKPNVGVRENHVSRPKVSICLLVKEKVALCNNSFTCSTVWCDSCSQRTQNCYLLRRVAARAPVIRFSSWARTCSWGRAAVEGNLGSFVSNANGQNLAGRSLSGKCSWGLGRRNLAACYRKMLPRHTVGSVQAVQAADARRILIDVPAVAGCQKRSTWTVWLADSSPASSGISPM
jgi:hypothetical protein